MATSDSRLNLVVTRADRARLDHLSAKTGLSLSELLRWSIDLDAAVVSRVAGLAEQLGIRPGRLASLILLDSLARIEAETQVHGAAELPVEAFIVEGEIVGGETRLAQLTAQHAQRIKDQDMNAGAGN